jgi:hypothetical protein
LPNHLRAVVDQSHRSRKACACRKADCQRKRLQQLLKVANAYPLKVMEAFMYRLHPQWRKAHELQSEKSVKCARYSLYLFL